MGTYRGQVGYSRLGSIRGRIGMQQGTGGER
jgi:hypothetical protein